MSINKKQETNLNQTIKGLAVYTTASILGPIVLFLGLGIFLDNHFDRRFLFKLISVGIAFIFTNILLFKKMSVLKKR